MAMSISVSMTSLILASPARASARTCGSGSLQCASTRFGLGAALSTFGVKTNGVARPPPSPRSLRPRCHISRTMSVAVRLTSLAALRRVLPAGSGGGPAGGLKWRSPSHSARGRRCVGDVATIVLSACRKPTPSISPWCVLK